MEFEQLVTSSMEELARIQPTTTAVIDADGRSISFSELVTMAADFAAQLHLEPGEMVGLSMPRSAELIAAMIGIVKAGGVYVPFAGDEPPERLSSMRARLGLRYWIGPSVQRLHDGPASVVEPPSIDGDRPLYVMWTSGSTGLPKAVVVPHRGVIRLAEDRTVTDFLPSDRMCFASNPAFDATTWEVWAALTNGVTVVVIPHDELVDARRLRARFETNGVTLAFLTTALFDHLARTDASMFGCLRTLAVGGEQMRPATVRAVLESPTPPKRLVNAYGPTEATTFSAAHLVTSVPPEATRIPIGGPLLQTELAVVDELGQPVHDGDIGELWVAGTGVALGYLGDDEATERSFVQRSLPGFTGTRWYRTGDLASKDDHGRVECLGRIDRQLKINGHRIEPAEIEHAMLTLPGVRAAAALARAKGNSTQLLAFAVTDGTVDATALTHHLRANLPTFLVPGQVHVVERLPVTANGKLDEAALLADVQARQHRPASTLDPLGEFITEQARTILGDTEINADDDLLHAGLDSLGAVELVTRITAFGSPAMPPTVLLGSPTPRLLADRLRDGLREVNSTVVRMGNPSLPPLFFVPGGGSTALFISEFAQQVSDCLRVVAVEPRGLHTSHRPDRTIRRMAARVVDVVIAEAPEGTVLLCGHSSGGVIAYEAAQQLAKHGRDAKVLLLDSRFIGNEGLPAVRWLTRPARLARRAAGRVARRAGLRPGNSLLRSEELAPRYRRYLNIARRASERYRGRPLDSSLLCLHVEDFSGYCAAVINGRPAGCLAVPGAHTTLASRSHLGQWVNVAVEWLLDTP